MRLLFHNIEVAYCIRPPLWSGFLATGPGVLGSIPDASIFSENQWVWNGVHSAS
jgi:hypothetical protein